jgi:hypothetical protein
MIQIILLIFAVVLLVLVISNVPVSQKVLSILFLLLVIFVIVNGAGWLHIR